MRVSTIVILLLIAGGVGYVAVYQQDLVKDLFRRGRGFTPASTPQDCVERFQKAIKARDYGAAATYCTGDYAELLKKAHAGASAVAMQIDPILGYSKDRGIAGDRAVFFLHTLDPFPTNFTLKALNKDVTPPTAIFELEVLPFDSTKLVALIKDMHQVDTSMFSRCLLPAPFYSGQPIPLKKDGEVWKLDVPLVDSAHLALANLWKLRNPWLPNQTQPQTVDYFLQRSKAYSDGMSTFRIYLTNERFANKTEFENELVDVFKKAK